MGDANVNAQHISAGGVGVLVQAPNATAPCTLPPYEDVAFVGRTNDLAQLDAWQAGPRRVLVLHGAPGVGKTRLAVEWAHRQAAAFPGGRYFLSFRADPYEALHEVARLRGVNRAPDERLDQWAIRTLHHVGAERALVLFDDIQSPDTFATWFGHLSSARAIVVTNERVWPAGYERVPVDVLELDDARALARGVIGDDDAASRYIDNIVERAARNAVQIVVDAGAVHEAVELGESPSLPPVPAAEAQASFERAWSVAGNDARTFVCALALYRAQATPHARVAEVLAADGWDDARTKKAATDAVRRHLVTREAEALSMHPLLRTFARTRGAELLTTTAKDAHAKAFIARATAFRDSPGDRSKYTELAHDEFDLAIWDTRGVALASSDRMSIGRAMLEAGQFGTARSWYERVAGEYRQGDVHRRIDHSSLGLSLHQVGFCLSMQGQHAEARRWYERAAEEHRKGDAHGRVDHSELGKSLHQVGFCLSKQGQFAEAREWYERAAEEYRQGDVHGRVNHSLLGKSLHQVGFCLFVPGQSAEARGWFERAAEEHRQGDAHGRVDHSEIGNSLHNVGFCLSEQGQFAEARGWHERAAEEYRQGDVHGRVDHSSLGTSLHEVGFCLSEQGQIEEARGWYERAVDEDRQGDIHGRVNTERLATTLDALARTLDRLGRPDDARPHREEASRLRAAPSP